ncbi:MAG: hypothetical protein HC831_27755 [Chloroflexia bacterium]|nr:hypothetical protein [Chloroflexia bacterium]
MTFLPIYLVLTYGSFVLLKWMNRGDLLQVIGLFNVKEMKKYVAGEN